MFKEIELVRLEIFVNNVHSFLKTNVFLYTNTQSFTGKLCKPVNI